MKKIGIIGSGQGGKNPNAAGQKAELDSVSKDNPFHSLDTATQQMVMSGDSDIQNGYTHPTILETSAALWHEFVTELQNIDPDFDETHFELGGFSLGQLFAMWAAGSFASAEDFRTFYKARADALDFAADSTPSRLRVLMGVTREELAAALAANAELAQLIFPAIYADPSSTVVGVSVETSEQGLQLLSETLNRRIKAIDAGAVMAFHTELGQEAAIPFVKMTADVRNRLVVPDNKKTALWSNSTGKIMVDPSQESVNHLTKPVEFQQIIEGMLNNGVVKFIIFGLAGNDTLTKKIESIAQKSNRAVTVNFVDTVTKAKVVAQNMLTTEVIAAAAE